jgi:hypothetical protein
LDLPLGDTPSAAPEGGKEGEKKGGLPEGLGENATWAAEKAIDFWYASDMAKASSKISQAAAAMKTAHKEYLNADELAKVEALASKLAEVSKAINSLKAKIVDRRNKYRKVAGELAKVAGGTPQQTQKMQAIINAIPACETVVVATSNIIDSIEDVPYTKPSGVAVGMAMNSGATNAAGGGTSLHR